MKFRFLSILLLLSIAGCAVATPGETPPPAPSGTSSPPAATVSPPSPSLAPSPSPALPPLGILLAPANADAVLGEDLRTLTSAWAEEDGLRFQLRETLSENDFVAEDIHWVVALPPLSNLEGLAASAPETRFLAVGFSDLEATGNLSVIRPGVSHFDQQGFMAGYIAAMITPDWRVGVIGLADDPAGKAAREGFTAGAIYFCGLCRSEYPPFFEYPLFVELDAEASSSQWQSAANILLNKGVETIYLVPGAGDDDLRQYLVQSDVNLIGGGEEVTETIAEHWVVSLRFDLLQVVEEHWPEFVEGAVGASVQVPLTLADINSDLLSPGRQRLAEKILEEVVAGFIEVTP